MSRTFRRRDGAVPIETLELDYKPSPEAWNFHIAPHRFRYCIWGIKSGKTTAGAVELVRFAFGNPHLQAWVVAPTHKNLETAEQEILRILYAFPGVIAARNSRDRRIKLVNGGMIQMASADEPDHLRHSNIGFLWIEEGGFIKPSAWVVLRGRVAATAGEIIVTTSPGPRNWLWNEAIDSGMPSDQSYGVFSSGLRWISHWPTWQFEYVEKKEIEDLKRTMSKVDFDREYGAMFVTDASSVFNNVEHCMHRFLRLTEIDCAHVMGLDLARYQDFTGVIIMDGGGVVRHVERWNDTNWTIQRARIIRIAQHWRASIVIDRSNVGSVIEEDLRKSGLHVHPVDMNAPQVKNDLIEGLRLAFERNQVRLPDPKADWATLHDIELYEELKLYEQSLTRGGRISYGAPKSCFDDLVIALALATLGARRLGMAGGPSAAAGVFASKESLLVGKGPKAPHLQDVRSRVLGPIFRRRRSMIFDSHTDGSIWGS